MIFTYNYPHTHHTPLEMEKTGRVREGKGGVGAKKEVWELDKSMLLKLTKGQNEKKKKKGIKKCEYKKHNVEGERKGRIKKIKGGETGVGGGGKGW